MKNRTRRPSSNGKGRVVRSGRRASGSSAPDGAAQQRRALIAQQAARLVLDQGIADYGFAKRKAAEQMGAVPEAMLPSNREVEQAVIDHQRLFGGAQARALLDDMRAGALEAMDFFRRFEPRAVGAVLRGAVGEHTSITLHVFADAPEDVARLLLDTSMPHRTADVRLRFGNQRTLTCPAFQFHVDRFDYQVVVLPQAAIREAPLSPIDGRPERRATRAEVAALLAGGDAADDPLGADPPA